MGASSCANAFNVTNPPTDGLRVLSQQFTTRLHDAFSIKYLGQLGYFLGLEVSYTDAGLFMSQAKYATDLLLRAKLEDSKPISTPMVVGQHLQLDGPSFADPTLYRSLVGALQYLTITRPDISFVVNSVSQFQQAPTVDHFVAVKRILRYVKGTTNFGIHFTRCTAPTVLSYSDADWVACPDTRVLSLRLHSFSWFQPLIHWSSKKQPTVSRSSYESEDRVLANAAADVILVHSSSQ